MLRPLLDFERARQKRSRCASVTTRPALAMPAKLAGRSSTDSVLARSLREVKAAAVVLHILGCCIRGESLQWRPQDRFLAMEVRNANKIEDSPGGAEIGANRMSPVQ